MDLIYTSKFREEQGVLFGYEMDLAFGADENDFECTVTTKNHVCENGSLLFFEGTEYGGMVDSIESNTATDDVTYSGRTWHGIMNSKVLEPDSGKDYLVLNGEANKVLASLVQRMGLADLFSASDEDSGITINSYKMNRYILGYDGIMKMLAAVGAKLKIKFSDGVAVLSAHPIKDYTQDEEFDSDLVPFTAKKNFKSVNHLVCLGAGELSNRLVVHLYADEEGNISDKQTLTDLDEITSIFEYSQISDEAELIAEGTAKFKEFLASDEIVIDFDADTDEYDVGDIIGAVDNITGLSAHATIKKKVLAIKNGQFSISLEPDTAKRGSTQESVGGGGGVSSGGDDTIHYNSGYACNLLDNSDFTNPVNQRGETSYSGTVYGVDRWRGFGTATTVTVGTDGLLVSSNAATWQGIYQTIENPIALNGKQLTLSCKMQSPQSVNLTLQNQTTKNEYTGKFTMPVSGVISFTANVADDFVSSGDIVRFIVLVSQATATSVTATIEWAALYEGEFTADTLPVYQPKGYATELAICSQYNPYTGVYKGTFSKDLLWQNASPTSDFAPQDIAVNVGEYDGIEIMFNAFNGYHTSRQGYWMQGSSNINLIATESDWSLGYNYFVSRRAGITATNVNFGTCYASNNTAKNGRMIPIAIYGIRGVG